MCGVLTHIVIPGEVSPANAGPYFTDLFEARARDAA